MRHLALVGDSIFDNAAYVPDGPAVMTIFGLCCPKAGPLRWWHAMVMWSPTLKSTCSNCPTIPPISH